jgi:hypothetical protein
VVGGVRSNHSPDVQPLLVPAGLLGGVSQAASGPRRGGNAEQGAYWRRNLARLVAEGTGERLEREITVDTTPPFRE